MTRRSLGLGAVSLIAALAMTGTAFAQTPSMAQTSTTAQSGTGSTGVQEPGTGGHAITIEVDTAGQTLVRGVLQSVTQNGMVLSTWGGNWNIVLTPNTQLIPAAANGSSASGSNAFQPGDIIGVLGTMSMSQNGLTVEASLVHDWTATGQASGAGEGMSTGAQSNLGQSFYQGGNSLMSQGAGTSGMNGNSATNSSTSQNQSGQSAGKWGTLYTGTASNIGQNSFTLSSNGASYNVAVNSSTILLDNARNAINYSRIQSGDHIRVDGHLNGSTVTATVVRDTSR